MTSGPELRVRAVVVDDGCLLMQRVGGGRADGAWSLPGGPVRQGELLAEAVVRTLADGTGVEGVCAGLLGTSERVDPDGPHQVLLSYDVTLLEAADPVAGPDVAEVRWVAVSDVADLVVAPGLAEFLHDHEIIATIT